MRFLLILACSATKRHDAGTMRAVDRYDGPLWQSLRKRLDELPHVRRAVDAGELEIVAISAEHGFIDHRHHIHDYEHRLTEERAHIIGLSVAGRELGARIAVDRPRVLVIGGELYRHAAGMILTGLEELATFNRARGIGEHRRQMGAWLRELEAELEREADRQFVDLARTFREQLQRNAAFAEANAGRAVAIWPSSGLCATFSPRGWNVGGFAWARTFDPGEEAPILRNGKGELAQLMTVEEALPIAQRHVQAAIDALAGRAAR